jgi:tetratricopeptide (TPR) repeat protein
MRTNWIFHLALLAAVTGCTAIGPKKPAAQPNQTSWTDKFTAPFKSLAPKKKPNSVVNAGRTEVDPISIGFGSGPATPALYVSMAQMSDQGGNVPHARAMYAKALSMDAKNLDAQLGLARLEDREGNLQAALQVYQQAVNDHPDDARALNDLALCHARCGEMPKSLQLLDQAVRMKPDKQLYRNNIAKVLIELNQTETAVAHLCAVYEPAVANYNMAVLLQERGRTPEAVHYTEAALAAKPQMKEASDLLATLTGRAPEVETIASGPALSSPISISAPTNSAIQNGHVTQASDTTPVTEAAPQSYPSTGAPAMIPKPLSVPAHTASAPVGYEPTIFPPIR